MLSIGSIEHRKNAVGLRWPINVIGFSAIRVEGNGQCRVSRCGLSPLDLELDYFALGGHGCCPTISRDRARHRRRHQWQPTQTIGLAMRAGLLDLALGRARGERVPNIETRLTARRRPCCFASARYLTAGIAAVADTRNSSRVPTTAAFWVLPLAVVPLDAEAESFTRLAADWRTYRSIGSDRHVAASGSSHRPTRRAARSSTPVYLLVLAGRVDSLRGFPSYRFRGSALAHSSIKISLAHARRVEIAPFVDVGAVAARSTNLSSAL